MAGEQKDFFISHAGCDRAWAEWVAWQLTAAGYTVELDTWDWVAGEDFRRKMDAAFARCDRMVALFSAAYFEHPHTVEELSAARVRDAEKGPGKQSRLIPLWIKPVASDDIPATLMPLVTRDLFGLDEGRARQELLEAVRGPRRPDREPDFPESDRPAGQGRPGHWRPRLPGHMPQVCNVQSRSLTFTGREELLTEIRKRLTAGEREGVQILRGMGGMGKTQLAIEYAHRFGPIYELVWWINAEQPTLIADQFAKLAAELGWSDAGGETGQVRDAVLRELRQLDGWLLVFDNAERPADVEYWRPSGHGHVLITSQTREWPEFPRPIEVGGLARAESVAMLRERVDDGLSQADAGRLADRLGDLPLAMAQAGGYMSATGTTADEFLSLLDSNPHQMLTKSLPDSYPRRLVDTTLLIAAKLADEHPAAAELASLCAFLSPEPIPRDLFTNAAAELPDLLAAAVADSLASWNDTREHLTERSLAWLDRGRLQMHRLTQDILRASLTSDEKASLRTRTEAILAANDPGHPDDDRTWPAWQLLMPHLLAADLDRTSLAGLRKTTYHACLYLLARGRARTARGLAGRLHQAWRDKLGEDAADTLMMAHCLAWAYAELGELETARDLDQDTLTRRRLVLGPDHVDTLNSASNLAATLSLLGQPGAAQELLEETLGHRRRVLGEQHPLTLATMINLVGNLMEQGNTQAARDLGETTLTNLRQALHNDHPDALAMASNLVSIRREQGELQAARDLGEDTLSRLRDELGEDHPWTLACADELAATLRALGDDAQAQELEQETSERRRQKGAEDAPEP